MQCLQPHPIKSRFVLLRYAKKSRSTRLLVCMCVIYLQAFWNMGSRLKVDMLCNPKSRKMAADT